MLLIISLDLDMIYLVGCYSKAVQLYI